MNYNKVVENLDGIISEVAKHNNNELLVSCVAKYRKIIEALHETVDGNGGGLDY